MPMPEAMPGSAGPQGEQQGNNPIVKIDADLQQLIPQLQQLPGGDMLAKRMMKLQQEYRAIMEEAIGQVQGGQQPQGNQRPVQTVQGMKSSPIPDRSMGTPQGPAGVY